MRAYLVGFIAGAICTALIWLGMNYFAVGYAVPFPEVPFPAVCASGETGIVCTREWANVVGIFAGFAAVFFVIYQVRHAERQHQANMALQTLTMRGTIARSIYRYIAPIERKTQQLASQAGTYSPAVVTSAFVEIPALMSEAMKAAEAYDDGRLSEKHDAAVLALTTGAEDWARASNTPDQQAAAAQTAAEACERFTVAFRSLFDAMTSNGVPAIVARARDLLLVDLFNRIFR